MRLPTKTTITATLLTLLPTVLLAQPDLPSSTLTPSLPTPPPAHLEIRQGAVVTAAAVASVVGQISPITTVQIGAVVDGVYTQLPQVYTQLFTTPLDQWPSATQGAIGLGTIQGEVGVVKSKRDLGLGQAPMHTGVPVVIPVEVEARPEAKVEVEVKPGVTSEIKPEAKTKADSKWEHMWNNGIESWAKTWPSKDAAEVETSKATVENTMSKMQTGAGSALAMVLAIAVMIVV